MTSTKRKGQSGFGIQTLLDQHQPLLTRTTQTMSTLERAIVIAAEGHSGAKDKGGKPYILHPLRVMLSLSSPEERIVAVLHDVCEDCPGWTLDRLRTEGFSERVITALDSVTKRPDEDYETFIKRAAADPIGRRVKLADLQG